MKKKVLIVLFSVFVAGIYAQAQKINVVSVSKERDIHNFYTMMKEAFPSIVDVNFTATMEDLLDKAMQQNFVPVLDDNKSFIGIITRRDIMKYFSGSYKKTGNA